MICVASALLVKELSLHPRDVWGERLLAWHVPLDTNVLGWPDSTLVYADMDVIMIQRNAKASMWFMVYVRPSTGQRFIYPGNSLSEDNMWLRVAWRVLKHEAE